MPTYKLKSLLYLLVFVLCAWVYYQTDTGASEPENQPVAELTTPESPAQAVTSDGI